MRPKSAKFSVRIESGVVVDTTIPDSIMAEAFHKSLVRSDLRQEF